MAINQARSPNESELAQINQYVPKDYAPITADEVAIVTVMVANNLLTYNYQKWSMDSLNSMPRIVTGKQATLNHDAWKIEKAIGKIFNATYTRFGTAPLNKINSINSYQADLNRAIATKEGYAEVTADIYYRKLEDFGEDAEPTDTVQKIRFGQYDRVSLGSFDYTALRCPDCTCEKGFPDMYRTDEICPLGYIPPMPDYGYEPDVEIGMWNGQIIKVAPYSVRDGLRNAEEISFVLAGNNPFAATVKG